MKSMNQNTGVPSGPQEAEDAIKRGIDMALIGFSSSRLPAAGLGSPEDLFLLCGGSGGTAVPVRLIPEEADGGLLSAEQRESLSRHRLENEITAILHKIGIPAHIKGHFYLRRAIFLTVIDMSLIKAVTKSLYPDVAKYYRTTSSCVERAIRYAIELAWNRGDLDTLHAYFEYTISASRGKPTNSEFIAMIADLLCPGR